MFSLFFMCLFLCMWKMLLYKPIINLININVSDSCDSMDCKLPSSSVHGTSQARILEGIAVSFSSECSWPRDQTWVSYIAGSPELHTDSLLTEPPEKPLIYAKYTSVKILQAGVLEWVAMSFSRRSSQPRDWTRVSRIAGRCFTIWATRGFWIKMTC